MNSPTSRKQGGTGCLTGVGGSRGASSDRLLLQAAKFNGQLDGPAVADDDTATDDDTADDDDTAADDTATDAADDMADVDKGADATAGDTTADDTAPDAAAADTAGNTAADAVDDIAEDLHGRFSTRVRRSKMSVDGCASTPVSFGKVKVTRST